MAFKFVLAIVAVISLVGAVQVEIESANGNNNNNIEETAPVQMDQHVDQINEAGVAQEAVTHQGNDLQIQGGNPQNGQGNTFFFFKQSQPASNYASNGQSSGSYFGQQSHGYSQAQNNNFGGYSQAQNNHYGGYSQSQNNYNNAGFSHSQNSNFGGVVQTSHYGGSAQPQNNNNGGYSHGLANNGNNGFAYGHQAQPAHYDFSYQVHDPHTGDMKHQQESRQGDTVHGQYSLIDADGFQRIVDYTSDAHTGFNAIVRRIPLTGHNLNNQQQPQQAHAASTPIAAPAHQATGFSNGAQHDLNFAYQQNNNNNHFGFANNNNQGRLTKNFNY